MKPQIAPLLLPWFERHGRKHLPWQQRRSGYRVWLSEIMLQQTQVATVIPYFERFVTAFPTVIDLADAGLDQVLQHWAGLGYSARARNLHKAAQQLRDQYQGELPSTMEDLMALPGIGRSTAGAILSLAYQQPTAILDGNVKRVLARVYQVDGWPGQARVLKRLWQIAEAQTPRQQTAAYNQAIPGLEPGLEAVSYYDPPNMTYPFGAYVCVMDIDVDTGVPEIRRFYAWSNNRRIWWPLKNPVLFRECITFSRACCHP